MFLFKNFLYQTLFQFISFPSSYFFSYAKESVEGWQEQYLPLLVKGVVLLKSLLLLIQFQKWRSFSFHLLLFLLLYSQVWVTKFILGFLLQFNYAFIVINSKFLILFHRLLLGIKSFRDWSPLDWIHTLELDREIGSIGFKQQPLSCPFSWETFGYLLLIIRWKYKLSLIDT